MLTGMNLGISKRYWAESVCSGFFWFFFGGGCGRGSIFIFRQDFWLNIAVLEVFYLCLKVWRIFDRNLGGLEVLRGTKCPIICSGELGKEKHPV